MTDEMAILEMLRALEAALPHLERLASFAPTTNSRMGAMLEARKARDLVRSALQDGKSAFLAHPDAVIPA